MSFKMSNKVPESFVQVEGQRAAQAQAQQENAVLSKVEKIRIDQSRRADALGAEAKIEENKVDIIHEERKIAWPVTQMHA